jgi:hypothetical protein
MSKHDVDELLSSDSIILKLENSRKVYAEVLKRFNESVRVGAEIE